MKLTHAAAAVVFAAAAGLGLATPAGADPHVIPLPNTDPRPLGTFTFEAEDGEQAEWIITPCSDLDNDHCVYVVSSGNDLRRPWTGHAYWTVGSWIMFVDQSDAILCSNHTSEPGNNNYSWDAVALTGYASINTDGACGADAASVAIPFTLTRTGEAPRAPEGPIVVEIDQPPAEVPAAPAEQAPPGPMPAESDPALVATPNEIPNMSDPLTEAIVAEPGFNATPGGDRSGGGRR